MVAEALSVQTVGNTTAFAALRDEWNVLANAAADTVFLTHSWLLNWLALLAERSTPYVLTARRDGALVAALPLAQSPGTLGARKLRFMGNGTLTPNHLDVLALPEERGQAINAFTMRLLDEQSTWDVLDLDKLPDDTETVTKLHEAFSAAGCGTSVNLSASCPYAVLPDTFDEYFAARSKSARRHTRERTRLIFREHPETQFSRVQTKAELDWALRSLVDLHQRRWRERGYAGSFADPRVVAFHRAVAADALEAGTLRFYSLREGERMIAAELCYRVNGCVQSYSCAFDPDWAVYRPGMVLISHCIEQSIAEGASRYDLLEGLEEYKASWAPDVRHNVRFCAFSTGVRGRASEASLAARKAAVAAARRVLPAGQREFIVQQLSHIRARKSS